MTSPVHDAIADAVPSVRPSVRVRRFRGRLLLAGPESALELSDTAGFILAHIDGKRTVADIGGHVEQEYAVPLDVAMSDTVDLIDTLVEAKLIELRR